MPVVIVDTEAAALVEAAVEMLEAALTARVSRADPDQIISNSLKLQAHKLSSFRDQLHAPDPPPWSQLPEPLRRKAINMATGFVGAESADQKNQYWEQLRGLINAAGTDRTPKA
jgi:hypothetical protein